ncbi:MAG TPA: Ldh family oxidoreductase [Anaerolineaceae bacterium]|nr:Ldh family oxidoreductase [Anaerolineaceae bacterium]
MSDSYVRVPVDLLQGFMRDTLVGVGVPAEDAEISSKVLIKSDLRGIESHGIGRLKMYFDRLRNGQHLPVTNFEIVRESPTTATVDAHHGVGMVIGTKAMNLAIEKARQYGMGSVAVRNSTHFGIDGYYALMAVEAGMIGMSFTNARPSISPTFGVQPMLGTNPIAFGAPTDEDVPFLFDAATSIIQRGKIEVLDRIEKPATEGWVINQNGGFMTNPGEILVGLTKDTAALLPLGGAGETLGGHKGYGLATIVEILSASLQTGAFLNALTGIGPNGEKNHFRVGHFFMAMKVEAFVDLDEFKKTTGDILRALRASKKAPGQERIFTAGEKEYYNEKYVREHGVPIPPNLQKDIRYIQKELGLNKYEFPF